MAWTRSPSKTSDAQSTDREMIRIPATRVRIYLQRVRQLLADCAVKVFLSLCASQRRIRFLLRSARERRFSVEPTVQNAILSALLSIRRQSDFCNKIDTLPNCPDASDDGGDRRYCGHRRMPWQSVRSPTRQCCAGGGRAFAGAPEGTCGPVLTTYVAGRHTRPHASSAASPILTEDDAHGALHLEEPRLV